MANLFNRPISVKLKTGLEADVNSAATKLAATTGELHYCTDTGFLYIFDGTDNVLVQPAVATNDKIYLDGGTNTYLIYNSTTSKVELFVGGVKKASWG